MGGHLGLCFGWPPDDRPQVPKKGQDEDFCLFLVYLLPMWILSWPLCTATPIAAFTSHPSYNTYSHYEGGRSCVLVTLLSSQGYVGRFYHFFLQLVHNIQQYPNICDMFLLLLASVFWWDPGVEVKHLAWGGWSSFCTDKPGHTWLGPSEKQGRLPWGGFALILGT